MIDDPDAACSERMNDSCHFAALVPVSTIQATVSSTLFEAAENTIKRGDNIFSANYCVNRNGFAIDRKSTFVLDNNKYMLEYFGKVNK